MGNAQKVVDNSMKEQYIKYRNSQIPVPLAAMAERRQSDLFCIKVGKFSEDNRDLTNIEQ